jgi:hypothetical protein
LTPERSIDLCLQTFLKLLLLLVPKVTTRSLYPECIANLKLSIDAFYRESRSGVNIAKRNITTGLFGLVTWMHSLKKSVKPEIVNRYDLWVLRHKIRGAKVFVNNVQWSDQMT